MNKNKKKKNRKKFKIAILTIEIIVVIIALIIGGFGVYYAVQDDAGKIKLRNNLIKELSGCSVVRNILLASEKDDYKKNVQDTDYDESKIKVDKEVKKKLHGYTNIALFGLDSREGEFEKDTHSDSIIVVSINNDSGEVKMASIYRDTMFKIRKENGETYYSKANEGFFVGGAEGAVNMLNTNLDLNITDYVVVNFSGLANIIDALGGIDLTISDDEQFYINGYLVETRKVTGMDSPDVATSGPVHLNGLQATAYCRNRYSTFTDENGEELNNDLGRTARQRYVLKLLVSKAKAAGSDKLIKIAKMILNSNTKEETFIKTSLDFDEIMDMIPTAIEFNLTDNTGFPYTVDMPTIKGKSMVVAAGLTYNVNKLHDFLFTGQVYSPSTTVQDIDDYISDMTGVKEVRLKEDETDDETEDQTEDDVYGGSVEETTEYIQNIHRKNTFD